MQPKDIGSIGQAFAFVAEGFAQNTFDGVAGDGAVGKTLGDDQSQTSAFGLVWVLASGASDHEQSPATYTLSF